MIHLGDITKISGYEAPIVDCIIGGSPCQDLSVAGKRAGLDGEKSGLFMEQLRIVKEMRERDRRNGRSDEYIRPRYMVWENVPGAFSSNKAEDFRIVLEEIAKVCDKDAVIPMPDNGKWTTAGCIVGDGWSIAWRVLDAQFYGVPQRRRRIALVADFGGHSAPEILFVRKSLSRDTESSKPQRKATPTDASRGIGADDNQYFCFEPGAAKRLGGYVWEDLAPILRTEVGDNRPSVAYTIDQGGGKSSVDVREGKSPTLTTTHDGAPAVCYSECVVALDRASFNQGKNALYDFEISDKGINSPLVAKGPSAIAYGINGDIAGTLDSSYYKGCGMRSGVEREVIAAVDCRNCTENSDINGTLQSHPNGGLASVNLNNVVRVKYIVRRLTPLECERLQGYPDGWTDIGDWVDSKGKVHKTSDAARYKALGNSIAIPPWKWVLKRLCACYERDATMASLFDGIGGFPLIWEQLNGKGSCLWASEIEEFPMAVTKVRIGE